MNINATKPEVFHAYIWVLPKSGTMLLNIFFNVYGRLLKDREISDQDLVFHGIDFGPFDKFTFQIRHAEWPNFLNIATAQEIKRWEELSYGDRIPWPKKNKFSSTLRECLNQNDTEFLSHCKMVFVYRNPLDQLISLYKHYHYLPPDNLFGPADRPEQSLEQFIFQSHALSSYIKMFYTFHVAKQRYPNLLMFVSYEQLVTNREKTLRQIINYLDVPLNETAFKRALKLTSLENLQKTENRLNRGLIILRNPKSRHIRNGGVGVWKTQMKPELIHKIQEELQKFDLHLDMFDFGGDQIIRDVKKNATNSKPRSRRRI